MTATALQACTAQLEAASGRAASPSTRRSRRSRRSSVGGAADLLVEARSEDELVAVVRMAARDAACRVTLLGGGSNVLVGDGGVRGVVVLVRDRDDRPQTDADRRPRRRRG